jgi:ABC-type Fe3+-hydroxamate transport system substrate-binding protein
MSSLQPEACSLTLITTDQLGHTISLPSPPRRIVSLVPSQTELLYSLGLDQEVIGITKFCIHPAQWHRDKPRVGGTKDFRLERVHELRPDLIIANKEENDRSRVEELARHFPVFTSNIRHLEDALAMIRAVGNLVGKQEAANLLAATIAEKFAALGSQLRPTSVLSPNLSPTSQPSSPRTAYLIWRNPWMAAGGRYLYP